MKLRSKRSGIAGFGVLVGVLVLVVASQANGASGDDPNSFITPAVCGAGSSPETGLQGQIPRADRNDGRSAKGYHCNISLVGQYQGQGAGIINPTYGHCAYFGTFFPVSETVAHPGVQVIDVSDPAHPRFVEALNSPAFLGGTWESLKVDPVHGYLAATGVEIPPGTGALTFDLYSIKDDCDHPKLLNAIGHSQLSVPTPVIGHEGGFSPDGNTYYATSGVGDVTAIDISDPTHPKTIFLGPVGLTNHGFSISPDGNTMYGVTLVPAGIQILDISDIQARKPNPQIRQIGQLHWTDGFFSQETINFTADGHHDLFAVDEAGNGGVRLIDIDNPAAPKLLREYRLQIDQPSALKAREADESGDGVFGYDSHYCAINSPTDPTMLACSYWQSGVRLYDISDLMHPRELGYYDPPAQTGLAKRLTLRNSAHMALINVPNILDLTDLNLRTVTGALTANATTDWCPSPPSFEPGNHLWVTCSDNGFLNLVYTPPA